MKHGHYAGDRPSPTYQCWMSSRQRARLSCIAYEPAWSDFATFLADLGVRPDRNHSLDRIDGTRGYVRGNVRWATRRVQDLNNSSIRWITVADETMCLEDWARRLGCSPAAISLRIKRGWTECRAVTTPVAEQFRPKPTEVSQ